MKLAGRILWYVAFFWILVLCGGTFLQYCDFKGHSSFLQIKEAAVKTGWYLPAFYCHIIGSSIILLAGFFQFSKKVYNNRPLHKTLGKLYVFGVLFFAAPGAYIMTLFVNRGTGVFTSFLLQNTLWVIFTLAAWLLVMDGHVDDHVKMIRRSYALAFGAVTLRFYIWLFTVLGSGVGFANNYLIIAFLSWVPNLLVAEWINYSQKTGQLNVG
jgi:heme/copper-type cytochrome/quinol oxidase subunit 4